MRFVIEPEYKKCLVERQSFVKDGKTITEEVVWRWGKFSCESDEKPVINEGDDLYSTDYNLELLECMDGDTQYIFENCTDEEENELLEFINNGSFYDLEFEGWMQDDSEMILDCPANIYEEENV